MRKLLILVLFFSCQAHNKNNFLERFEKNKWCLLYKNNGTNLCFEYTDDSLTLKLDGALVSKNKIISIKSSDSLIVFKTSQHEENEYHFRMTSKDTLIYSEGNEIEFNQVIIKY
jgi:hypothetical protein